MSSSVLTNSEKYIIIHRNYHQLSLTLKDWCVYFTVLILWGRLGLDIRRTIKNFLKTSSWCLWSLATAFPATRSFFASSSSSAVQRQVMTLCFKEARSAAEAFQKWEGTNSGAKRHKILFYWAPLPNFFVVPPMTGHYMKVQGTVTRTELGETWPTVRGQSDLWLFSHAVSKVT